MSEFNAQRLLDRLGAPHNVDVRGSVRSAVGLVLRAAVPDASIGELCEVHSHGSSEALVAEVVGFRSTEALLMPLGDLRGIGSNSLVRRLGRTLSVPAAGSLIGRVLDGLGRPADGRPLADAGDRWPVHRAAPNPLERQPVCEPFHTGVRAIDGLLTVGVGQRMGIFAGAGVGKSTLLGMIARNAPSDVVVIGLVGERGREVREFLESDLGEDARSRSVTVVATSDQPPIVRLKAAYVATSIAEQFRAQGLRVLFLLDSITRFARALREVGLAAGEPPARAGYPPSVFAELPRLLERTGNDGCGAITAFYTVLVEGDDHGEPVADETRSILDGHIVLSAERAARDVFPAIDIGRSASRTMARVVDDLHGDAARAVRGLLATYERERDLLILGAYETGTDQRIDDAAAKIDRIEAFLQQRPNECTSFAVTRERLVELAMPDTLDDGEIDPLDDPFGTYDDDAEVG